MSPRRSVVRVRCLADVPATAFPEPVSWPDCLGYLHLNPHLREIGNLDIRATVEQASGSR